METCLVKCSAKSTKKLDVYIRGPIEEFEYYDPVIEEFANLSENDVVYVHLNTPGGDCAIGFFLIDQILSLPCPVHMIVEYPTYSMGAIMALCGTSLRINPDSYIMFHDYSGGAHGKGEDTAQYVSNYRRVFKDRFTRLCKPFLSLAEVNKMFKGEDLYIYDGDNTGTPLEHRLKKHFNQ